MKIIELTCRPECVEYNFVDTPIGKALVAWCPEGLVALYFGGEELIEELKRIWGNKIRISNFRFQIPLLWRSGICETNNGVDTINTIAIYGTPFQKRVWRALIEIPSGETLTYSELAARMGIPSATRAVASAVARNEISVLIPCHRIVPKSGGVGNYRWGAEIKKRLLSLECH